MSELKHKFLEFHYDRVLFSVGFCLLETKQTRHIGLRNQTT